MIYYIIHPVMLTVCSQLFVVLSLQNGCSTVPAVHICSCTEVRSEQYIKKALKRGILTDYFINVDISLHFTPSEIVMEDDLPNPKTSIVEVEEDETTKGINISDPSFELHFLKSLLQQIHIYFIFPPDKDRQPPSNRFFGIKRNHIYIALGAIASIVIVISVVLATTLKNQQGCQL